VPLSNFSEKVAFIWSVADLLRGPYKPHQYGRVILPLTVLRRLDCVLEPTKAKVLEKHAALKDSKIKEKAPSSGVTSPCRFAENLIISMSK
jgi:type I restriction enzyme M protein